MIALIPSFAVSATFLLSAFMRAGVSLERIRDFLDNTEELDDEPRRFSRAAEQKTGSKDKPDAAIVVAAKSKFRFSRYNSSAFTLHLCNDQTQKGADSGTKSDLVFPRGKTTLVAGDVGSGKSALLLALLGELHVSSGGVEIRTEGGEKIKTSYAAQSPWLQGAAPLPLSGASLFERS